MLSSSRFHPRWLTVATTTGILCAAACGGTVAGEPSPGDNLPNGDVGIVTTTTRTSGGYGAASNFGTGITSITTRMCSTYSCNVAACPNGTINPPLADGCPGPCECQPWDGGAVDATLDGGELDASFSFDVGPPALDECVGSYEFDLQAASGTSFCAVTDTPAGSGGWLTIHATPGATSDAGTTVYDLGADPSCSPCEPASSEPLSVTAVTPAAPLNSQWDGLTQTTTTCTYDNRVGVACSVGSCTKPGAYVARMCAWTDCSMQPPAELRCVDVPFVFPFTGVIAGTLN